MTLYPHQVANATKLVRSLKQCGGAIDASSTGTGKSFTAFAVAAALRREPFIICPLGVGPSWTSKHRMLTANLLGEQQPLGSADGVEWVNYEKARRPQFNWPDLNGRLVIMDEAHRVGAPDTQQSRMVKALVRQRVPTLFLSATPFASPMRTRAFLHATNHVSWDEWYNHLPHFDCYRAKMIKGQPWIWKGTDRSIEHLKLLLKDNMVATHWTEVEGFPDFVVAPESIRVSDQSKAEALARAVSENPLGQTMKERKELEHLRVPAMAEMAKDLADQGHHVLAFFNFTEPLDAYVKARNCAAIDGRTVKAHRTHIHNYFQSGRIKELALNGQAAGEGVDLHGPSRVSLISPPYSPVIYKQEFGRTHRIGGEMAIMKPVFVAGTIEETKVLPAVVKNAQHIDRLTEAELTGNL